VFTSIRFLVICALALAALASACRRSDYVPGMEGLPKELAPYARKIASSKLPHVSVTPVRAQTKPWESKLLGVPYFPKDRRWPMDRDGKPLVMLAQINFAEIPPLEGYPTEGILQLYVSPGYDDTHGWGMRIDGAQKTELARLTDQSYFRVVYFPTVLNDAENLISETPQIEFSEEHGFPISGEARLTFKADASYVRHDDYRFRRYFGKDGYDFFYDDDSVRNDLVDEYDEFIGGRYYQGRIGGYSRAEQRDPRLDFSSEEWLLLFSLDSFVTKEYSAGWADGGVGNFYIRRRDLAKRDFRRVMHYWDCG
jgi:uncharacterized protein YwqG